MHTTWRSWCGNFVIYINDYLILPRLERSCNVEPDRAFHQYGPSPAFYPNRHPTHSVVRYFALRWSSAAYGCVCWFVQYRPSFILPNPHLGVVRNIGELIEQHLVAQTPENEDIESVVYSLSLNSLSHYSLSLYFTGTSSHLLMAR